MSYFRSGDPEEDFDRQDREQARIWERLPFCEDKKCHRKIDDDYYFDVDGEILCEECMIRRYRRNIADFEGATYE